MKLPLNIWEKSEQERLVKIKGMLVKCAGEVSGICRKREAVSVPEEGSDYADATVILSNLNVKIRMAIEFLEDDLIES